MTALGRILIVDDEEVILDILSEYFAGQGYVAKPFDFGYLDRAVTAGLLQAGPMRSQAPPGSANQTWRTLALAVFRAARTMPSGGRASTGERLETAVLAAVREAAAGREAAAASHLDEIELLLTVAADLGDLSPAARTAVDELLKAVRSALPGP